MSNGVRSMWLNDLWKALEPAVINGWRIEVRPVDEDELPALKKRMVATDPSVQLQHGDVILCPRYTGGPSGAKEAYLMVEVFDHTKL